MSRLSPRLAAVVDALPLQDGSRVIEVGCGTGAAARAVAERVPSGHVLAVDRSATAVAQTLAGGAALVEAGRLSVRQAAVERLTLEPGEEPYDLAFANRVGALDGRHPELAEAARACLRACLRPGGRFLLDGREVPLDL